MKKLITIPITLFLTLCFLLPLAAQEKVKYNKGDKVWVLQPRRKATKFMAVIWSNRDFDRGGYYEIMYERNTYRAEASEILGIYDEQQMKFKIGDQVGYYTNGGNWANGVVKEIKNALFIVSFEDARANAEGMRGLSESKLLPVWTYKEFFEEIEAYVQSLHGTSVLHHIAAVVCGECSSNGQASYFQNNVSDVSRAQTQLEALAAIVAKYPNPPDNGRKFYTQNPKLMADIVNNKDAFLKQAYDAALRNLVAQWYRGKSFVSALNSREFIMNDKGLQQSWSEILCEDAGILKKRCMEHIDAAIKQYGLTTTADSYFADWDNQVARIRTTLEESTNVDWSPYKITDKTHNALIGKTFGPGFHKVVYRNADFSVVTEGGVIKSRQRTGTVIYKIEGCKYWRYFDFMLYQDYEGGGKYGTLKCLWSATNYTKPF